MTETMDFTNKRNLWVLYLEGGVLSNIHGPFSMNDIDEGIKEALRDNNYDESYDTLVGLEIDAKGRPHDNPIAMSVIEDAAKALEEDMGFDDPDFDDEDELDGEDTEEDEC